MAENGLTTSSEFLRTAASKYFDDLYESPIIEFEKPIDPSLAWAPSLNLKPLKYMTIVAEVSETPYPRILRLRHADILQVQFPISVYCVCPDDAFLSQVAQKDVRDLQAHGYGLLTVDADGCATKRHGCVPLIQHIPSQEVVESIRNLPKKVRIEVRQAYESYNSKPTSGVKDLAEILEAMIIDSGKKIARKGWIKEADTKSAISKLLSALDSCKQTTGATAAIGGAKSYMSVYRNAANHTPKSKLQAYTKYKDCAHAFRDGIRVITRFREAMKNLGINASI